MNWLLVFNGAYGSKMAGSELRYIKLAESLVLHGDKVAVAVKDKVKAVLPETVSAIPIGKFFAMASAINSADRVVINGGSVFLFIYLIFIRLFFPKKIILMDIYATHWIELSVGGRIKTTDTGFVHYLKIVVNLIRLVFALNFFSGVVVANKRQVDLARGAASVFSGIERFGRILQIGYGADTLAKKKDRTILAKCIGRDLHDSDYCVGWLGGVWPWMGFDLIRPGLVDSIRLNRNLLIVIFGVDSNQIESLKKLIPLDCHDRFCFVEWIPYAGRIDIWSGLDLSIVWGRHGYENDYASRTRNFDCVSARVPILQNYDDDWGPIIISEAVGCIANLDNFTSSLVELSRDVVRNKLMSENIAYLQSQLSWGEFSKKLINFSNLIASESRFIYALNLTLSIFLLPFLTCFLLIANRRHLLT